MSAGEDRELAVSRVVDLVACPKEDEWLIEDLWGRSAVGIIGGQPKCLKTWLALEMAVSVASGTSCLERFAVAAPGPALIFLAEDALGQVRERIEGLCKTPGRRIESLDLFVITEPVLRLDDPSCRERLERTVERHRPRLLVLDPLVRLHRLDENSSQEISRLLGTLRELERRYEVSIVLVHHASKRRRANLGQSLRGSSDLHAWTDSMAMLTRKSEQVVLTLEHRFAAPPPPMVIGLVNGGDGPPALGILDDGDSTAQCTRSDPEALVDRVFDTIESASGPLRKNEIRKRVRVNNQRLGEVLAQLERAGRLEHRSAGWACAEPMRCENGQLFATETG